MRSYVRCVGLFTFINVVGCFLFKKRVIFLFSLYVPFHIDTLTLANVGICCRNVGNQFFKFCFLVFEISKNFNQIKPMFFLNLFGNIISDINFIIKSITRNLIIFKKPRKMTNDFSENSSWLKQLTDF